jgi:hypothetical protein
MNVRPYYEDCIYGIPARIERDSVDAVVTSPPYNCGTRYNICNDRKAWEQRGHYKPITSRRFVHDCHEFIFHLTKRGDVLLDRLALGVPYADKSNIARWGHTAGRDLHCRGNTWFIPYRTVLETDLTRQRFRSSSLSIVSSSTGRKARS